MQQHATTGVAKSKPRFKPAKEELPELSREYLQNRNAQMRSKNATAEIDLVQRRGELIEKRLVESQAAYIFVAFRQRILGQSWTRRFVGLNDLREAKRLIDEMARSTLTELAQFPQAITDPNWLDEVNGDGEKPQPISPVQVRRNAQAKELAHAKRKVRRGRTKDKTGKWV